MEEAPHNIKSDGTFFLQTRRLGFRYTHDEFYAPTGLQHPSYMMTADEYRRMRNKIRTYLKNA